MVNSIYLNARYNITTSDFYASGGTSTFVDRVAAVLGIPIYSIRVVGIASGSTIISAYADS